MFFNEDILFRNGPLALVWIAGNENLKTKKKRKDYLAVLNADVKKLCDTVRNLFPQMGTSHGVPLKKMGLLARGLGSIYLIKMENFQRDVLAATALLKKPVTVTVDINQNKAIRGKKAKPIRPVDLAENEQGGEIVEEDRADAFDNGGFDFNFHYPSPRVGYVSPSRLSDGYARPFERMDTTPTRRDGPRRNLRKRSRDEDEDDVLARMFGPGVTDPRAHTMREDDGDLLREEPQPQDDLDLDFGDGMALLCEVTGDQRRQPDAPLDEDLARDEMIPQPELSEMGPPSTLHYDRGAKVMETPMDQGTTGRNVRKRRNEGLQEQDADETVMELPGLDDDGQRPRQVNRARRRLRLKVDACTSITLKEMLLRVNGLRTDINFETLENLQVQTRAPEKSSWKMEAQKRKGPMGFIMGAGRPCPSFRLHEMMADIRAMPIVQQRERPIEQQREDDVSSVAGVSHASRMVGRTAVEGSTVSEHVDRAGEGISVFGGVAATTLAEPVHESIVEESPPIIDAAEELQYGAADDYGVAAQMAPEEEVAPEQDPFREPVGRPRRARTDEAVAMGRKLDGEKSFEELYPPNACKKKHAARAFLLLLKMQAKKSVCLKQEEFLGNINIEKLQN